MVAKRWFPTLILLAAISLMAACGLLFVFNVIVATCRRYRAKSRAIQYDHPCRQHRRHSVHAGSQQRFGEEWSGLGAYLFKQHAAIVECSYR